LNFLLEIALIGCIIYLSYTIFKLKEKQSNADSLVKENESLKNQLTQLHNSFSQEQASIREQKLELKNKENSLIKSNLELEKLLAAETENRKKITHQKKSSEVRLGHIAETLAPFLDQFDFEPEQCSFLGQPIDYISFGEDEITFIEVKSGKSQLNSKQRHIRDLVKNKFVSWKEIRIQ
jgi:predicted Holliday junction resolvase-like endonuclease